MEKEMKEMKVLVKNQQFEMTSTNRRLSNAKETLEKYQKALCSNCQNRFNIVFAISKHQ